MPESKSPLPPPRNVVFKLGITDKTGELVEKYPHQIEYEAGQWTHRYNAAMGGLGSAKTSPNLEIVGRECLRHSGPKIKYDALRWLFFATTDGAAYGTLVEPFLQQFRRELVDPETGDTLIQLVFSMNKSENFLLFGSGGYRRVDRHGKVSFPCVNPCRIDWTGLDPSRDQCNALRYSGRNYDGACGTQLESLVEDAFDAVDQRLGRREIPGFMPRMLTDSNVNAGWSAQKWVYHHVPDAAKKKYFCVFSTTEQNTRGLTQDYLDALNALPAALRDKLTGRNWGAVKGKIFDRFSTASVEHGGNTVRWDTPASAELIAAARERGERIIKGVCQIPFEATWSFYEALDYGWKKDPTFCVWLATDHEGNLWILDELALYRHTPKEAADKIKARRYALLSEIAERLGITVDEVYERFVTTYGPHDMATSESYTQQTRAEMFWRDKMQPGDTWRGIQIRVLERTGGKLGDSQNRLTQLAQLFIPSAEHVNPVTGEPNAPRCYVSDRCRRLAAQLDQMVVDSKDADAPYYGHQKDPFAEDLTEMHHWDGVDAASYGVQGVFVTPREEDHTPPPPAKGRMRDTKLKAIRNQREEDD